MALQDSSVPSGSASRRTRILIVEDDALVALGVRTILEDLGHTVCGVAACESEALAIADRTRPELALMDVRLRGSVDGIDVARRLNAEYGIRSIYLSAYTDQQTMSRITATYPLGFVQKPYSATQLKNALDLAIRRMRT